MKLKRNLRHAVKLGLLLLAIEISVVMGCRTTAGLNSTSTETISVPDEARLRTRIQDFYTAVGSKHVNTMYQMHPPYIRAAVTLDDYKKDWGFDEAWSAQAPTKISAELETICSCSSGVFAFPDRPKTLRCVLLLSTVMDEPSGQRRKGKMLEMWEYLNGEWYYGYPGEYDHCPADPSKKK